MKVSSNFDDKIVHLQQEIKSLKATQILGGDNSKVYKYYVVAYSPTLYKKGSFYIRKRDYDDPEYVPVPMSAYTVTSLIYPVYDDPFALVGIEKIEVWRSGRLLSWGDYTYNSQTLGGQKSQYGDSLLVEYQKQQNSWSGDKSPRLGTTIRLTVSAPSSLSDNPGTTVQYEYRVWLRSTAADGYTYREDIGA